jgi:error-prone DNA polymerase
VPTEALVQLAKADAFRPSLQLERRDALWAIKALRDEPLPLFAAAAEREMTAIAEQQEPEVALRQMTEGHNVIEDCGHTGLTLRQHPIAFLRPDLTARNIISCVGRCDGGMRRPLGLCRSARPRASEAGIGKGGDVHHHRG